MIICEDARTKQIGAIGYGDTCINVFVDIIDKTILFDEDIKEIDTEILQDILKNAKKEIKKGGY